MSDRRFWCLGLLQNRCTFLTFVIHLISSGRRLAVASPVGKSRRTRPRDMLCCLSERSSNPGCIPPSLAGIDVKFDLTTDWQPMRSRGRRRSMKVFIPKQLPCIIRDSRCYCHSTLRKMEVQAYTDCTREVELLRNSHELAIHLGSTRRQAV
jgi:hypothetical protein